VYPLVRDSIANGPVLAKFAELEKHLALPVEQSDVLRFSPGRILRGPRETPFAIVVQERLLLIGDIIDFQFRYLLVGKFLIGIVRRVNR
jgi:hypothetical protein